MAAVKKSMSIRLKFFIFSATLFLLIVTAGSAAFFLAMRNIIVDNIDGETAGMLNIERNKLESSVKGEIAIALKMASSPLIIKHFLNPADSALKKIAFEEIQGYRRAFGSNTAFWISDADKKFYSDDAFVYVVDPKDKSNYWYPMTMTETDKYNFNINYNENVKKILLWINAVVRDGAKKPVGIVGTGINLSAFADTIYKDYTGKADLYFFNAFDEITGAKNGELVSEKKKLDAVLGEAAAKEVAAAAKGLKAGENKIFHLPAGEAVMTAVPALEWYAIAIRPITKADYDISMTTFFIIVLAVIAAIFVVFNALIAQMIKPLRNMTKVLHQTSEDWDLTRRLEVKKNDEIGIVARSVNEFMERLHSTIKTLSRMSGEGDGDLTIRFEELGQGDFGQMAHGLNKLMEKLHTTIKTMQSEAKNLSSTSAALFELSNVLSKSSETTLGESISVSRQSRDTSENVHGIASEAARSSAGALELSATAEQMGSNMNTVIKAVSDMNDNFNKITDNTRESKTIADHAIDRASAAMGVMDALEASVEEIGRFTNVIKTVAKKTNLLALNASVEAAHAGEAGKGFAVVANEVKQLANQSVSNANDITRRIENIQAGTADAIGVIREISSVIKKMSESANSISESVERQIKVSADLTDTAKQTNIGAQHVVQGISDVAASIQTSAKHAGVAADGARRVSNSIGVIKSAAEKTNDHSTELKETANSLKNMAEQLDSIVCRFKT
ncbi:MAG: methyl-accepting chemotaxis protein [Chitinispirillales bacterium]|nr:methyl-accepting chemotaxis protein [Chitinispirillales bacterium]